MRGVNKKKVYILGLKSRGQEHYGLTTWLGEAPIYYAIYNTNPGYWDDSEKVEPLAVSESEQELLKRDNWNYIGFGWLKDNDGKIIDL